MALDHYAAFDIPNIVLVGDAHDGRLLID
jgi:hypothetical protein